MYIVKGVAHGISMKKSGAIIKHTYSLKRSVSDARERQHLQSRKSLHIHASVHSLNIYPQYSIVRMALSLSTFD